MEVRALKATEQEEWLDLLEHAFSYKGVGRAFFEQHALNDPWFECDSVRVCVDTNADAPRIVR